MVKGPDGAVVGSLLIAQPFTKDEYFQPRPSACSYDASASSSSALGASNYALRARVASTLGPIVQYENGRPVAPDIEKWFQQDYYAGASYMMKVAPSQSPIVAQWADAHNSLAQSWVGTTFDPKNQTPQQQYVLDWAKTHPDIVAKFKQDNPSITQMQPSDLAVVFFESFSKENPGRFPSSVTINGPDGKPVTSIQPVKEGSDIQATFFDMWRQDNRDVLLKDVPGDLVTTSASGLDPHISLQNAEFQLDRVAGKWAADLKRDPATLRKEIDALLNAHASAPFGGLAGEPFVNVLEINLLLRDKYGVIAQ